MGGFVGEVGLFRVLFRVRVLFLVFLFVEVQRSSEVRSGALGI